MDERQQHLDIALQEIGEVLPLWSEESQMYVFEHEAYPAVMHADPDREKAAEGYLRALQGFIQERLEGNIAPFMDRITSGRGGARPGAGRPKGSVKGKTKMVRLPEDIAIWIKQGQHLEQVRALMEEAS